MSKSLLWLEYVTHLREIDFGELQWLHGGQHILSIDFQSLGSANVPQGTVLLHDTLQDRVTGLVQLVQHNLSSGSCVVRAQCIDDAPV
jgi:hypothetical protein